MQQHQFIHNKPFILENGEILPQLEITYHTAGKISEKKDNIIWVCHAFTANSDVFDWWKGFFGHGYFFDPNDYFIICANYLGSCYGSTGPMSINPHTQKPYLLDFPFITVRDMVNAHELLRKHLGIEQIHLVLGGSIGGFQALEWSLIEPELIQNMAIIASCAKMTPWAVAFSESQRMALRCDPTFLQQKAGGGINGLKAARSIALLSYRNAFTYNHTQSEDDDDKMENLKAVTYQQYQGEKLAKRFDAYSYYSLTLALDTHNIGRKRGGVIHALTQVKTRTMLVGISSDLLFPKEESIFMNEHIPDSEYIEIDSFYGHDGFLLEIDSLSNAFRTFLKIDE